MAKIILIVLLCAILPWGCAGNQMLANSSDVISGAPEIENSEISSVYETESTEVTSEYEGGSDEAASTGEETTLVENSELFEKYPDEAGWMEACDCGDIPYLADAAYIEESLSNGIFLVSTPEELASFNYIVNTSSKGQYLYMMLQNDIDLAGYEWAPMGWNGGDFDLPFTCVVEGNGYKISNMSIDCDADSVGFIGWENNCGVSNLNIENAIVSGNSMVGVMTGQAIGGRYENCHVSGEVNGSMAGSMHGHSASSNLINCTADVTVNGAPFAFLTWNEKEISEIDIEYAVTITLHDDYTVTRPPVEGYENLGWLVQKDGVTVLHRNAEDELSYRYFRQDPGEYTICLTAWVDYQYVPVSNTVEYTIE